MSNVLAVVGQMMAPSCVKRAFSKPSLYAPSAGDRASTANSASLRRRAGRRAVGARHGARGSGAHALEGGRGGTTATRAPVVEEHHGAAVDDDHAPRALGQVGDGEHRHEAVRLRLSLARIGRAVRRRSRVSEQAAPRDRRASLSGGGVRARDRIATPRPGVVAAALARCCAWGGGWRTAASTTARSARARCPRRVATCGRPPARRLLSRCCHVESTAKGPWGGSATGVARPEACVALLQRRTRCREAAEPCPDE